MTNGTSGVTLHSLTGNTAINPVSFAHFYNANGTALYNLNMSVYVDPSISLAQHVTTAAGAQNTFFERQTIQTIVSVSAVPVPASLFAPQVVVQPTLLVASVAAQLNAVQPPVNPPEDFQLVQTESRTVEKQRYLTLLRIPEDGSTPQPVPYEQDGEQKEGAVNQIDLKILDSDQLIELFKTLPDGRYRLDLHRMLGEETLDERTVLETKITNGVPANPIEELIEQIRRNLDSEETTDKGPVEGDGAMLEVDPNDQVPVAAIDPTEKSDPIPAASVSVWAGMLSFLFGRSPRRLNETADENRRGLLGMASPSPRKKK